MNDLIKKGDTVTCPEGASSFRNSTTIEPGKVLTVLIVFRDTFSFKEVFGVFPRDKFQKASAPINEGDKLVIVGDTPSLVTRHRTIVMGKAV